MAKDEWITSREAATILTGNSGHPVSDAYVRRLGLGDNPKLRSKSIDRRTKLYLRRDVEAYRVAERGKTLHMKAVKKPEAA
jgi:hypothetical protein